jgi:hypothetical protein
MTRHAQLQHDVDAPWDGGKSAVRERAFMQVMHLRTSLVEDMGDIVNAKEKKDSSRFCGR